ncbi:MAG: glycosyltransferase family 2 protein [Deltaproteobacteria bacterium]|nr:glycosyltransferase family 2 protein [Deltaproteobacteria bacterium]
MDKPPLISVIIPVHNGNKYLNDCLDALNSSSYSNYETIVVDDCSTDDSVEIGQRKGAKVYKLSHNSGPAAARNYGARMAEGDILVFVDSDVIVQYKTIERVADDFRKNPHVVAVFGSYDESPAADDFLSQFRNLLHHFIHQNSEENAKTFWAGFGAIYRKVFLQLNGFDEMRYKKPSIEDIELGLRICNAGHQILLDKDLQVKHLKQWSWSGWLKTDILNRALPWSKLIIEKGILSSDLNLKVNYRISSFLAGLVILILILTILDAVNVIAIGLNKYFIAISVLLIIAIIILNLDLYNFFFHKRGLKFMFLSIPLHFLYYLYSGITFVTCWILHKFYLLRSV